MLRGGKTSGSAPDCSPTAPANATHDGLADGINGADCAAASSAKLGPPLELPASQGGRQSLCAIGLSCGV